MFKLNNKGKITAIKVAKHLNITKCKCCVEKLREIEICANKKEI